MPDESVGVSTYLLTHNPKYWGFDPDELASWVEATAAGHSVLWEWSTGSTRTIQPGDRAFLLRQGAAGRGIFASGTFASTVFTDTHFSREHGIANYAVVLWDTVLDPEDRLPIEDLFRRLPEANWQPRASGAILDPADAEGVWALWGEHVSGVRDRLAAPQVPPRRPNEGQGRRLDAALRKQLEDLAQLRLTRLYESDGWQVEDLRVGNPFDAKATHPDGRVHYLEAKGTTT